MRLTLSLSAGNHCQVALNLVQHDIFTIFPFVTQSPRGEGKLIEIIKKFPPP